MQLICLLLLLASCPPLPFPLSQFPLLEEAGLYQVHARFLLLKVTFSVALVLVLGYRLETIRIVFDVA